MLNLALDYGSLNAIDLPGLPGAWLVQHPV
jgi:hypothetical protein